MVFFDQILLFGELGAVASIVSSGLLSFLGQILLAYKNDLAFFPILIAFVTSK
jgi:hypothetical protein